MSLSVISIKTALKQVRRASEIDREALNIIIFVIVLYFSLYLHIKQVYHTIHLYPILATLFSPPLITCTDLITESRSLSSVFISLGILCFLLLLYPQQHCFTLCLYQADAVTVSVCVLHDHERVCVSVKFKPNI